MRDNNMNNNNTDCKKIENILHIFILTYNRLEKLQYTIESILESPVSKCLITILNNNSSDGTTEYLHEIVKKNDNIQQVVNNRNIGGNANITRAFEMVKMPYIWVLCDDDEFDFSHFDEILNAILSDKYDCILTEYKFNFKNSKKNLIPYITNTLSFLPSGIYKTLNITETVMSNMEANIMYSFPHLMLVCHLVNIKANFYIPDNTVIKQRINSDFSRGLDITEQHIRQKNLNLITSYICSYRMINDSKLRYKCCEVLVIGKSFFKSMFYFFKWNKFFIPNVFDVFINISLRQKFLMFIAFIFFLDYYVIKIILSKTKLLNITKKIYGKILSFCKNK